ncbi:hypothetical protein Godav_024694 [Gossypium davidsonii]|uniref:Uncharacterized protein n=1 Tax=Gossypium davidsonii TaxID=34287 RepID=A0A7J8TKA9_GOSDV|nr:hypothetical protein [Gossypium davidsonii]
MVTAIIFMTGHATMENVFHIFLPLSTFTQYTQNANAGNGQSFSNYGKNGNDIPNDLNSYRKGAYVVGSSFSSFGEAANVTETATMRRSTVSQAIAINPMWVTILSNLTLKIPMERKSIFQTTANLSMKEPINSQGRAKEQWVNPLGSKSMEETTLLRIIQKRASFSVDTTMAVPLKLLKASGSVVNKWVEPGKFFREKLFKRRTVMPMLEIRDKMPRGARRDQAVCGVGGGHDRFRHLGSGAERGGWFDGEREGVKAEHKDRKR